MECIGRKPYAESLKKRSDLPPTPTPHRSNWGHTISDFKVLAYICFIIVSLDESRGYFGFSTVTPPQRFPFGHDNLKSILVRTFKFGMWVYMGNATNAIVL